MEPNVELINQIFSELPPFELSSGLSHTELAKRLTIKKGGRKGFKVHVFKNKLNTWREIEKSPFTSYTSASLAIGINKNSKTISRYIDTEKFYVGRGHEYKFYSELKSKNFE